MRAAVHDVMTFWLNKRIDGFRADVINLISKAPGLPNAPVVLPGQRLQPAHTLFANGPRLHEFLRGLRSAVLNRYDCMVVGEMPWLSDRDQVLKIVGEARGELDMIFQFDMSSVPVGLCMRGVLTEWQRGDGLWPRRALLGARKVVGSVDAEGHCRRLAVLHGLPRRFRPWLLHLRTKD